MESIQQGLQILSIQLLPFMVAVIFHEFAHGLVAKWFGDRTAQDQGRLTLNPLPHLDPFGTVLFPVMMMVTGSNFLFGWAKPVPINPSRFKNYRVGLFFVSFAGPGMNILLGVFSAFILCALVRFVAPDFVFFEPFLHMARIAVPLNFSLAFFNLLPLPPLDGSKIVESFLNYNQTKKYEQLAQYTFWILLALMFTGALTFLAIPVQWMSTVTISAMMQLFGLAL